MKMIKTLYIVSLLTFSLVITQCDSTKNTTTNEALPQETMELSQPAFASSKVNFNTWIAGMQDGGSGVEIRFEMSEMEDVVLNRAYFRESAGKVTRSSDGYEARFRTDNGREQDIIMSGDVTEEAVNTPPVAERFPFPLAKNEIGVSYTENGVLKYTKFTNVEERTEVAYPSAPPRDKGN